MTPPDNFKFKMTTTDLDKRSDQGHRWPAHTILKKIEAQKIFDF